jgi:myosin protein heavy chain
VHFFEDIADRTSDSGSTQVAALTDDLRRAQRAIEDVQALVKKHEASLAAKQREIADLLAQQQQSTKARELADQAKIALQVRIDGLSSDLASKEREKKDVAGAKDKLQKELDDLRKVMAAKTSEDSKRLEADKSREAEMSRLRDQALAAQKALEAQKDSFNQISSKLKVEMEDLRQRHVTAERELKAAKAQLQDKAALLSSLQAELDKADEKKRAVETELRAVQGHIGKVEAELKSTVGARDVSIAIRPTVRRTTPADKSGQKLEAEVRSMQDKYNDLEDAVLLIEDEKAEWAQRMESTTRQLVDENAKRQHLEQQLHNSHVELAQYRNIASTAEREMAKAASDIKARDSEIALLRSRENKTIVEHVHVLEQAKKVTDRQLVEQVKENSRLNTMLKTNETHRNRLIADLEDKARECEMLKKNKSKEARVARASMSNEDKEASMALEDERKARKFAEAKIASLERDLQDQRRQLSTANLHTSNATSLEAKLQRRQDEFFRLEQAHDLLASENQKLQSQILELQRSSMRQPPSTPKMGDPSRAELLRGLQQSHDALGRDMNDQLRKLDAQPLTPSRRHNTSFSNGTNGPATPDPMAGKRMRQLETEIAGLRNQLDDERDEKEFLIGRLRELEGGAEVPIGNGTKQLPYEQAMYSHFRLKAKSLRTQLDQ